VVYWRCVDLRRIILARYNINLDEFSFVRMLKVAGFSHISARPKYLAQEPDVI
jgi:Winged helix-turn helix